MVVLGVCGRRDGGGMWLCSKVPVVLGYKGGGKGGGIWLWSWVAKDRVKWGVGAFHWWGR